MKTIDEVMKHLSEMREEEMKDLKKAEKRSKDKKSKEVIASSERWGLIVSLMAYIKEGE
jgi:hypothetical protein